MSDTFTKVKEIIVDCGKEMQEEAMLKTLMDISSSIKVSMAALWVAYLRWSGAEYE